MKSVNSYAKINIFLRITGKREDGYHDLQTLFAQIDLHDVINLENADSTALSCSDQSIPTDESNLILKVYRILTDRCDLRKSYRIHLEKHIPAGGGLGGGSSNAAAFLKLVNEDASLGLTYNDMAEILGGIGSDTVYFLHDAPCYAEGRGEVISAEAQLPPLPVLLVNPGLHIPTGEIFSDRNLKLTQGIDLSRMPLVVSVDRLLNMLENTMESVVFLKYPVMEMFKRSLLDFGASGALMSGSGSTLFGIFRTEKELEAACVRFSERHPDVRLFKSYIKGAT